MAARVLIVDDEPSILTSVGALVAASGYEVTTVSSGRAALETIDGQSVDVIVLDLGLPDIDGVEMCRLIREERSMPIIVLSARSQEASKVGALDAGADDYVTKPFGAEELLARIRAALRRATATVPTDGVITCAGLVIDRDRNRVLRGEDELRMTPKELDLLALLARHPGRVLTHRTLLKALWGPHAVNQPEHLRVLVASLRKKLEPDPAKPTYIITEPWVGYRFADARARGD